MKKTKQGFDFEETGWKFPPDKEEESYVIKYGIGYWNGVEMARVPAVMTVKEWNRQDPELFRQLDENLINSVEDVILMRLKWPPHDKN